MKTIQLSDDEIEKLIDWYNAYEDHSDGDSILYKKLCDLQKAPDNVREGFNDVTNDVDLNTISSVEDYRRDREYRELNDPNWNFDD